jgi:hypothetical protein
MKRHLTGGESGLAAYYKVDEGSGGATLDATANLNDGQLVNGTGWADSTAPVTGF